ncbi:MAG: class II fructose-bisphosphate aldolase, partial [Tabrizicola sp.]
MIATLAEVLGPALRGGYAVPGLVCLGWEDARAFVRAAEAERAPVILQAGPGARAHMPAAVWGAM